MDLTTLVFVDLRHEPFHGYAGIDHVSGLHRPRSSRTRRELSLNFQNKKGLRISPEAFDYTGGADRDRTDDLLNAICLCYTESKGDQGVTGCSVRLGVEGISVIWIFG